MATLFDDVFDTEKQPGWKTPFCLPAGLSEYRLFRYLAKFCSGKSIVEAGTLYGSSAIAWSSNPAAQVDSLDVGAIRQTLKRQLPNLRFHRDVTMEFDYSKASIVYVDINHNGHDESQLYENVLKKQLANVLILFDDINLNGNMVNFWNSIKEEKYKLIGLGHVTVTGLVILGKPEGFDEFINAVREEYAR